MYDPVVPDPCPHCEAPLPARATFCRECGWDEELAAGAAAGEDVELPEGMDEQDYEALLAREGLDRGGTSGASRALEGRLLAVFAALALLAWLFVLRSLS